jgi:hypothetical protein
LPGIGYLTELKLSAVAPHRAPQSAQRVLRRTATSIARIARGVIVEPDTDSVTVPAGVQRFIRQHADGYPRRLLSLSWWFTAGPLLCGDFEPLLRVCAAELPEALPRRYGTSLPPEYEYAEEGREHFLAFLRANARGLASIWHPSAPVVDVMLGIPESVGNSKKGFRAAFLTVTIDADALRQAGWERALRRFWRAVSELVQPFYGDVRQLDGYRRSRGRYLITADSERHPVRAWWWGGIPPGPAQALVLGQPYLDLWPLFAQQADVVAGVALQDGEDWAARRNVFDAIAPAPQELLMLAGDGIPHSYPKLWPFAPPRP